MPKPKTCPSAVPGIECPRCGGAVFKVKRSGGESYKCYFCSKQFSFRKPARKKPQAESCREYRKRLKDKIKKMSPAELLHHDIETLRRCVTERKPASTVRSTFYRVPHERSSALCRRLGLATPEATREEKARILAKLVELAKADPAILTDRLG